MRIAVCVDDPAARELLLARLAADGEGTVTQLVGEGALLSLLEDDAHRTDVLITDVQIGACDCIELLRSFEGALGDMQVVFASAQTDRVWDAYAVPHTAFLPPPFSWEHVSLALARCRANMLRRPRPSLILGSKGVITRIRLEDILYVESELHVLHIHTVHGCSDCNWTIETVKPSLDYRFFQCHKSFMVNMAHVAQCEPIPGTGKWRTFRMDNGDRVPISVRRQRQAREAFLSYVEQHASAGENEGFFHLS